MKKAISRFLKAALVLTLFLFTVSIVYVSKSSDDLDADSMLLAMLLLAFSSIASLIIGVILVMMKRHS